MPETLFEPQIPSLPLPTVNIPENIATNLGEKRINQRVKMIVEYTVIEKTKSFVVLRTTNFFVTPSKRIL